MIHGAGNQSSDRESKMPVTCDELKVSLEMMLADISFSHNGGTVFYFLMFRRLG